MNKKFTKLIAALALLLFVAPPISGWGQTRTETVVYTLDGTTTGGSNGYATESDITQNNIAWKVTANTTVNPWRFGGKSITNEDRPAYTTTALTNNNTNITKVVITTGNATATATVNSVKLIVADNSSFTSATTLTESWVASSTITFNRPTGADWTDKFFKIVYNVSVSGSSNQYAQFVRAEFYAETGTPQPTTYTVTYNGNGNTSGDVPVDDTEYDDDNNTVTVLGPGDLAKTGHTFEWWSDMEDGTDEDANLYEEDDTFEITENTTLYAQWSVNTYNYTLNVTGDDGEAMAELQVDGSTVAQDAKIAYDKEVTVVVAMNTGYNYSIEVKDADNNDIPVANDKFTMPASDVTVSVTTTLIPTYTITFNAGSGTCNTPTMSDLEGSTINLPTAEPSAACASRGWEFAGWATTGVSETTNAPTLLNGDYTITADADLYAVYKVTEGEGGTTEFNFAEIAAANEWENSVAYTEVTIAPVTIEAQGGGNNGKWYTNNGGSWRMYSGGTVEISVTSNNVTAVTSTPSCDFTINNGTASYSPSARTDFTNITVTYGTSTTTYNSNPSCLEIVATPTFTIAAGTYTGAQTVEINCGTTGAGIYYTLDGSEPNNQSTPYNGAISIATSTTLKAIATNDGMDDSEIATAEYVIQYILTVSKDHVGFGLYDYYVDEDEQEHWDDIDVNEQTGTALVRSGANVRISVEDVDDCYLLQGFNVVDGDNNPVQVDNLMEEDGTYSFIMPASNATLTTSVNQAIEYTLTVVGLNNVTYTEMHAGIDSEVTLTNNQATLCEGINVDIVGLSANAGLLLQSVTLNDGTTTTTLELDNGVYHFTMPSSNATLTFTVSEIPTYTYTLATSIESGKTYIIVGEDNGNYYAMGEQRTNNRGAYAISVDGNTATVSSAEVHEVVITALDGGKYTIEDGGYLYAANSNSNYLKTEATLDDNGKWTIGIAGNGDATITAQGSNSRNLMRFNPNNGSPLFACYATNSTTGSLPRLYVKDEPATETHTLTINGYGNSTTEGWNLIASPVSTTPVQVTNMLTDETTAPYSYDLYRFNQAAESEWENYHQHSGDFNIVPGKGYLYANKGNVNNTPNTVTLTFTGVPYSGDGEIELVYSTANSDSKMHGWNLIGNPFSTAATLNLPFFKMNGTGSGFTSQNANSSVAAMEGVLVYAYDDGASQPISTATFTAAGRSNSESAAMVNIDVVSSFGDVMDNAIVNFNEGIQLPKFYFGTQNANIYIPQGNKEYAVVSSEAQGEMPVNFRATKNGTYTLTVNPEGVEMNYLHLIDNMTGADIDLLAATSTGSVATYTFNASTTDYSSRFRLVFAANNEDGVSTGSTAFAFYSNGTWVINNTGEATLQVVDVNGRILSSETVNGSVSKAINAPAGVYMLRLINGNDVKTQKIVVR